MSFKKKKKRSGVKPQPDSVIWPVSIPMGTEMKAPDPKYFCRSYRNLEDINVDVCRE